MPSRLAPGNTAQVRTPGIGPMSDATNDLRATATSEARSGHQLYPDRHRQPRQRDRPVRRMGSSRYGVNRNPSVIARRSPIAISIGSFKPRRGSPKTQGCLEAASSTERALMKESNCLGNGRMPISGTFVIGTSSRQISVGTLWKSRASPSTDACRCRQAYRVPQPLRQIETQSDKNTG